MEKMNAVNLEKMYEVLKFVEYGGYCRRSMDCVHGMLLIDRMKNEAVVDKAVLFGWFRKMAVCAEQYERCGEGQNYKYLNPYGIVLSDEGEVLFLDTESRENAEVMKQMQKRAVRSHFIRPVYEMDTCGSREPDLFGYGNTLRFMLAYMKVVPALTKREEIRLFRICGKCIGETRKKYSSFLQVLKELPTVRNKTEKTDKKRVGVWSGMKTEQIQTYGQLIEWEQDPIQLEEAGVRKMKLEAAQGDYKQAAETGKKVLERIEASEKITKMLKGYELYKGEEGES